MSDLRKAAEMALEALEHAAGCVQDNYLPDRCGHDWDEQIEALRQALAQQDTTLKFYTGGELVGSVDFPGATEKPEQERMKIDAAAPLVVHPHPAFAALPKREWVGLKDADIAETMRGNVEGSNMLPYSFARAIEAKLKEKNT